MSSTVTESTEPITQLQTSLQPVPLKYIALPTPLPDLSTTPITITASNSLRPPCRRCLQDASPGEVLHLIAYDPFPQASKTPYRGTGAIFVHAHDCELFKGESLPERQLKRLLSIRAFDQGDMMLAAEVIEGEDFERVVGVMLADKKTEYVHVHNAKPGCFAVKVERA